MPVKVLVVDSVATNRIVLKVKLLAAFYNVVQVADAEDALAETVRQRPDLIVLGSGLDSADRSKLCKQLKHTGQTAQVPIVAVTGAGETQHRLDALNAGADDVLSKPIDDLILMARLRSLLRARDAERELELRDDTARDLGLLGFGEPAAGFTAPANVAIVSEDQVCGMRFAHRLNKRLPHRIKHLRPSELLNGAPDGGATDVYVIAIGKSTQDNGLGLVSNIRSRSASRHAGILALVPGEARQVAASALDQGANDLIASTEPDIEELALRLTKQVERKRTADRLRSNMKQGLQAAVMDPLTGLYNRRYAMPHLARIAERCRDTGRRFAVMMIDLDHFKRVNDSFGHSAGDAVLIEVARRLKENLRAMDMVARVGGEEFLVAMPETDAAAAKNTAARICRMIQETPFQIPNSCQRLTITTSIGIAIGMGADIQVDINGDVDKLLRQADRALYGAKSHGRNQFTFARPAA